MSGNGPPSTRLRKLPKKRKFNHLKREATPLDTHFPLKKKRVSKLDLFDDDYDTDPTWTPALELNRNRQKTKQSRQFRHHIPVTQLNGNLVSPAKSVHIVTEEGFAFKGAISLETLQERQALGLSTPSKGVQSSSLTDNDTLLLRSRTIKTHKGRLSIYLSENKVNHDDQVQVTKPPKRLSKILKSLRFPKSTRSAITDIPISLESLSRIKQQRILNGNRRSPSNAQVVNNVSANLLAKKLGLPGKDWQFLHIIANSLWEEAQNIGNFVLGHKEENGIMYDIAEGLVEKILKQSNAPELLYLSGEVEWVTGFEKARLAKKIIWTLRDGPENQYQRYVTFEFNPLSTRNLSKTEIEQFEQILFHLFLEDDAVKLVSPNKKTSFTLNSPFKPKGIPQEQPSSPMFLKKEQDVDLLENQRSKLTKKLKFS